MVAARKLVGCLILAAWVLTSAAGAQDELAQYEEGSVGYHTAQGMTLQLQGKLDDAIAQYRQALSKDKTYFSALFNLALARQQKGELELAEQRYREALQQQQDHPEVHCNLGVLAFERGRYREAVSRFAAAAGVASANDLDRAEYRFNLGAAHERLGEWVEARKAYERCIAGYPDHFGAHYNLGTLYLRQLKNPGQAERYLKRALAIDPKRPEPSLNLAVLEERRGRDAEQFYTQAVTNALRYHQSMVTDLLWRRARYYGRRVSGGKPKMRKDLQDILDRDGDYPGANGLLGLHYEAMGKYNEAVTHLEREVAGDNLDPKSDIDRECLYTLAKIFSEVQPNKAKARTYATAYYRIDSQSAKSRYLFRNILRLEQTVDTQSGKRPGAE